MRQDRDHAEKQVRPARSIINHVAFDTVHAGLTFKACSSCICTRVSSSRSFSSTNDLSRANCSWTNKTASHPTCLHGLLLRGQLLSKDSIDLVRVAARNQRSEFCHLCRVPGLQSSLTITACKPCEPPLAAALWRAREPGHSEREAASSMPYTSSCFFCSSNAFCIMVVAVDISTQCPNDNQCRGGLIP